MTSVDNSDIEAMAVHFFKGLFLKVGLLKTFFAEGDKTPLVDGRIHIYREREGNKKNEDLVGTIPVQIKGTTRDIPPDNPTFSLARDYLEGLKSLNGVLLLVAALQPDKGNHKGYYAHLFRFQIENLLKDMKSGQKQKSIPLKELPHDPEKLLEICYQAKDIRQKSTYILSVHTERFHEPKELFFTLPEPLDPNARSPFQIGTFPNKNNIDTVIETEIETGIKIPINASLFFPKKEYFYQPTRCSISSGEIIFHNVYRKRLSEKQYTLALSPGLSLTIDITNNEGKIKQHEQDVLYYFYRDLKFLKSVVDSGVFYIDDQKVFLKNVSKVSSKFDDVYQKFSDLYKLFEILKVDSRLIRLNDLTKETLEELDRYIQFFVYEKELTFELGNPLEKPFFRKTVIIGGNHLHFIVMYNADKNIWSCSNLVSGPIRLLRIIDNDNEASQLYSISAYSVLMLEKKLGRTLNLDPENLIVSHEKALESTPDAEKTSFRNLTTHTVMKLITSADLNPLRRREFLTMAKELNEWLLSYEPESPLLLTNRWQILHRDGLLTPELKEKIYALKRSLSNKDIHCEITCAILLRQFKEAQYLMEQLSQEGREIKSWPIYYLFEHQETPYDIPDLNENPAWPAFFESALREEATTYLKQITPNPVNEKIIIQPPIEDN